MRITRLQLAVETGHAVALPGGLGYRVTERVSLKDDYQPFTTWSAAHSVAAAPHINANVPDNWDLVWTSEDVAYVDGTRAIRTEARTTFYVVHTADDVSTHYVRTTITRES